MFLARYLAFVVDQIEKTWRRPGRILIIIAEPARLFWRTYLPRSVYIACLLALLMAIFAALSGGVLFPLLAVALLVFAIIHFSRLKHRYLNMYLHAYDLIFFLRPTTLKFAFSNVSVLTLYPVAVIASAAIMLPVALIIDPFRISRLYALAAVPVLLCMLPLMRRWTPVREMWMQFFDPSHLVNFIDSIPEAFWAGIRGRILTTGIPQDDVVGPALQPGLSRDGLRAVESRPTIVAIMQESLFPPSLYDFIRTDGSFDMFFRSSDGIDRLLKVETFGGGSWMSEFSYLTGIPASCYGPFRAHIFHWSARRIGHSLPRLLQRFGYRTAMHYPCLLDVMSARRFYESIGFADPLDRSAFGFETDNVEDRRRYEHALNWLTWHFENSGDPAFLSLETSTNHFPHDTAFLADRQVAHDLDRGNEPEINEYLRRLSFSIEDYSNFREALIARFPGRPFLLVHFGDHQPPLLWKALGERKQWRNSLHRQPGRAQAYQTYYALDALNYSLRMPADMPRNIDVPRQPP